MKEIVIKPCLNQAEILQIALAHINGTRPITIGKRDYTVITTQNHEFICRVKQSSKSIIFEGKE